MNGCQMIVRDVALNTKGRDFAVGDIHGSFDLLDRALAYLEFNPEIDRLFSVGDLIDRGSNSVGCLEFLSRPYVFAVRGNHEENLLDLYVNGHPDERVLEAVSGRFGLQWLLSISKSLREEILEAFLSLPIAMEVETSRGTVGFVHADVPRGLTWQEFRILLEIGDPSVKEASQWGRDRIRGDDISGVRGIGRVFVGHTPQWGGVKKFGNVYAIDTGAVFGAKGQHTEGRLSVTNLIATTATLKVPPKIISLIDTYDDIVVPTNQFGNYAMA